MNIKKSVVIGFCFLFVFLPVMLIHLAFACECAPITDLKEDFDRAEVVFIGKVDLVEPLTHSPYYRVRFQVIKFFKGFTKELMVLKTSLNPKSCDYPFKEDVEYLVYCDRFQDKLIASTCGKTKELSNASEDLKILEGITILPAPK